MIQSVDRAIRVLIALQGARRMSLSELAARLELPPSTVHGIVRTLRRARHGRPGARVGPLPAGPGGAPARQRLPRHPRAAVQGDPVGRGPRPATGLAVRTGVLLLDDVVIIHHEPRPDGAGRCPRSASSSRPTPARSARRCSRSTRRRRPRVLAADDLRSMTGETITDPATLEAQLAEIRASGIATEAGRGRARRVRHRRADLRCRRRGLVGAIGLVAPSAEWPAPGLGVGRPARDARARSPASSAPRAGRPRWLEPSPHAHGLSGSPWDHGR